MSSTVVASADVGLLGQYHVVAQWDKDEGYHLYVYDRRDARDGVLGAPIFKRWHPSKEKVKKAFDRAVVSYRGVKENRRLNIKNPTLIADQLDVFQRGYLATFLKQNERVYLKKIQMKLRANEQLTKGELEFLGDVMAILMRQEMGIMPQMVGAPGFAKMRANPHERSTMTIRRIGRVRPEYQNFSVWFSEEGEEDRPALFDVAFLNRPEMRVGNLIEFEYMTTARGWRIVRADFQVSLSGPPRAPQVGQITSAYTEFTTGYVTKLKGEEEGDQPYRMAWAARGASLAGTLQGISGLLIPEDVTDAFNAGRIQNGLPKILPSYGHIIVDGAQDGRIFRVAHIHDFQPDTQERVVSIPLVNLDYQLNSIAFDFEGQRGYINMNLPFDAHPTLNTLKQHFTGNVTVRGKFKKEGFWDRTGEHNYWFYLGNTAEWSDTSIDNLRRIVRAHRESEEIRRLIDEYYNRGAPINMEEFSHQLSTVLGRTITPEQAIRNYIPHPERQREEYEWEYIDAIKAISDHMGGQYLYIPHHTSPEFVFVINNYLILEIPITNKASYVFRLDAARGIEQQLSDIRAVPQRSAIYLNENIGRALKYLTRVVHRTVPGWADRVKAIVEEERTEENPRGFRVGEPEESSAYSVFRHEVEELGNTGMIAEAAEALHTQPTLEAVLEGMEKRFGSQAKAVWLTRKKRQAESRYGPSEAHMVELPEDAVAICDLGPEGKLWVWPGERAESNPRDSSADVTLARELALYATNTADISKNYIDPVVRNLANKRVRQIFDRDKALQLIVLGAKYIQKRYWKEVSGSDTPPEMNHATKLAFAEELYGEIEGQIDEVTREILMGMRTRRGDVKENPPIRVVEIVTEEVR